MIITRYRLSFRLLELSQNTLIRTSDFLDNPSLGAIDATCQVFHPVGVTQKLCMQRAERALDPELWPKREVMCWPEWADEVQFRARMRDPATFHSGRISAGYEHALVLSEEGTVRSRGSGQWGQLGHGDTEDKAELTVIAALRRRRVMQS